MEEKERRKRLIEEDIIDPAKLKDNINQPNWYMDELERQMQSMIFEKDDRCGENEEKLKHEDEMISKME